MEKERDINPLLLCDTYKTIHEKLYDDRIEFFTSYLVPRKSMLKDQQKMIFFGTQYFLKKYLIEYFNENFFNQDIDSLIKEYTEYMNIQLGFGNFRTDHIKKLHKLGYLPLKISALPEGSYVDMKVPVIEVTNTVPGFHWLVQWIECLMQNEMWKISNHATISAMYFSLFKEYYDKTTENADPYNAAADFGIRGMSCIDEAKKCSGAWLIFSNKTSTIPALHWLDKYYNASCSYNKIGVSAASLEHSVVSSSFALNGDEKTLLRSLLTDKLKNTSFSYVSDTYDYWKVIKEIAPELKKEIMDHNGKILFRPDSGDQVSTVIETVQELWNTFGGTENKKGYKVLDNHVGVILGDGCTLATVKSIFKLLDEKKFAANNVVFGIGAFCFTSIFENGKMIINTRDTFGEAFKVTHMITKDGEEHFVYKDPKTDTESLKKSHKGVCVVYQDNNTKTYYVKDAIFKRDIKKEESYIKKQFGDINFPMEVVFCDGALKNETDFIKVRERAFNEVCVNNKGVN